MSLILNRSQSLFCIASVLLQLQAANAEEIRVTQANVRLINECRIPARDSGQIEAITVQQGTEVRQGQEIGSLDRHQQELALQNALLKSEIATLIAKSQLNLLAAKAQVEEAEAAMEVRQIARQVAEKEATNDVAVAIAQSELKLRELELERAEKSKAAFDRSISGSQLDRRKTDHQRWLLEIDKAKNELAVKQLKPKAEQAAVDQAQTEVARAKVTIDLEQQNLTVASVSEQMEATAVEVAKWNLDRRRIVSPIDGVVASTEFQPGEWVEAGVTLLRVIDLTRLRVEGFISAQQASQELTGQPVEIHSGNRTATGKVVYVGREIDPVDQVVEIVVEFDNSDGRFLPGMIADMNIQTKKK